jgi:hypothetical protein
MEIPRKKTYGKTTTEMGRQHIIYIRGWMRLAGNRDIFEAKY